MGKFNFYTLLLILMLRFNNKNQDFSFLPKSDYYLQSIDNIGSLFKMTKE